MNNLVLLVVCFAAGVAARRLASVPRDGFRVLNAWVLTVSLPALVLRAVHGVALKRELFVGAATLWVSFGLAAVVALLCVRRGWLPAPVAGALALSAGLGNTAFVGLPLIEVLAGADAVPIATMIDQLGSFGVLSAIAVPFAVTMGGGRLTARAMLLRVVKFPPFMALVVALLTRGVTFSPLLDSVLLRLADMMSPLALASVGWQFDLRALRGQGTRVAWGLGYKLVVAPLMAAAVLWVLQSPWSLVERVTVVQAAMPPMVTSAVLAADNRLDSTLAAGLVAVGLIASLATVPLWWALTGWVGG